MTAAGPILRIFELVAELRRDGTMFTLSRRARIREKEKYRPDTGDDGRRKVIAGRSDRPDEHVGEDRRRGGPFPLGKKIFFFFFLAAEVLAGWQVPDRDPLPLVSGTPIFALTSIR